MDRLSNNDIRAIDNRLIAQVSHYRRGSVEQRRMLRSLRDEYRNTAIAYGRVPDRDTAEINRVYASRAAILLSELNEEVRGARYRI